MVDSANLKQHVDRPTHISGHTLDLILIRSTDNFVSNISPTYYLPPDHAAVLCQLNIARPEPTKMEIKTSVDIDVDAFCNDISNYSLYASSFCDLDLFIAEYEHVLQNHNWVHFANRS